MNTKILAVVTMVMFSANAYAGGYHRYHHSNYRHNYHYRYGDYGYDRHEYTNDLLTVFGVGTGVGVILGSVINPNNYNNCNCCNNNNNNVRIYDPEYDGKTDCYKTVRRVWENGKMHEVVTEICNGHKVILGY